LKRGAANLRTRKNSSVKVKYFLIEGVALKTCGKGSPYIKKTFKMKASEVDS